MNRTRSALLLSGLFALGAVCGGFTTALLFRHHILHRGFSADRMERAVVRRLTRRLGLDEDQRRLLETTTRKARREIEEVRAATLPKVEAILDEACDSLKPALRPDQQKELEEVRAEARERLRKRIEAPADARPDQPAP